MEINVLIEMRASGGRESTQVMQRATTLSLPSFQLDTSYAPVPVEPSSAHAASLKSADEEVFIVRGTIEEDEIQALEAQPNVSKVWRDATIAPCAAHIPPPSVPTRAAESIQAAGTLRTAAEFLGVDEIWDAGHRGEDIVIGIVDGGITAEDRPIVEDEQSFVDSLGAVPRVIDGWPEGDWGTTGMAWRWHGNMTATDALGMAPEAHVYDIRIVDPQTEDSEDVESQISEALAGFQWAIERHRADGTPHILSNSWAAFNKSEAPDYVTDPDHPFTRKVVEAIEDGILVLFAAGNCGEGCPAPRCESDTGPGRSIWGANGHPRAMTVGAVDVNGDLLCYSSQGPASLDSRKPDFCSASHFRGYFSSDDGTSAACAVAAGVAALLKEATPSLNQAGVKHALQTTAKDISPEGWDRSFGSGIIQARAAFDYSDFGDVLATEGTVTFLRVHDVGTGWGPPKDSLDVEVIFELDTDSDQAFGFQLREDANEGAHRRMLDLLRDAFNRDHRVRVDYVRTGFRNGRAFRIMKIT